MSFLPAWFQRPKSPVSIHQVHTAAVPNRAAEVRADQLSARISANITRSVRRSIQIREALGEEMLLALKGIDRD